MLKRGGGGALVPAQRHESRASLPLTTQAFAELVAAQEAATPAGLMAAMAGFVDPGTADYLMRDSGARPR